MSHEINPKDRCQAILKWIYHGRCSRRAVKGGLCAQHHRFGATVPCGWLHRDYEYGPVELATPLPPFETREPGDAA